MDREQARSYRNLWWPAVILWELACQRWHHCGLAERPRRQWLASKLAPTGICGCWRILWELACQRWHHGGLYERPRRQWLASKLAPTGVVVAGGSCGSWLASDDITAVCMNERGASGSRASSLLQEFVVAGGSCGSWLASDGITAVCLNERGASGSPASSLLQKTSLPQVASGLRLLSPLTRRWIPNGLAFFNASGSRLSG